MLKQATKQDSRVQGTQSRDPIAIKLALGIPLHAAIKLALGIPLHAAIKLALGIPLHAITLGYTEKQASFHLMK